MLLCPAIMKVCCVLQTITVIAEVEKSEADTETPATEDTETAVTEGPETEVNVECSTVHPEELELASAREEDLDVSLSELQQALPKLPPRLPQVPPRPAGSRARLSCSQSLSAATPRPRAFRPKLMHCAQSSATSDSPPVPPRAPCRATTIHNDQPTLSSFQRPAAVPSTSTVVSRHTSQYMQASPDALGNTFNYVYFTDDAVPPAPQLEEVTKSRKHQQSPDVSRFSSRHATSVGKKLAESGLGAVNAPSYGSGDDGNPAGSYVRLAVTTPPPAVDPFTTHDYCYPSIDSVVLHQTESVCRIEPQRSPPPLPTKSCRVGWWGRRRQRARCSQLRATWSQRSTTYGTEQAVVASHLSLNNSQSSSLNTRRPPMAWRARLVCFVRTCNPCRWRRRWWQRRRSTPGRGHFLAT